MLSAIKSRKINYIFENVKKLKIGRDSRVLYLGEKDTSLLNKLKDYGLKVELSSYVDGFGSTEQKKWSNRNTKADKYNLIIANKIIEYSKFDQWELRVMSNLLKSNGILIVTAPNLTSLKDITDPLRLFFLFSQVIRKTLTRTFGKESFRWYKTFRFGSKIKNGHIQNHYRLFALQDWFSIINCRVIYLTSFGFYPFKIISF